MKAMSAKELYPRMMGFVRPYWKVFALSMLAMAGSAATEPLFPALLKPLLDGNLGELDPNAWWTYPLLILGIFLLRGVIGFLGGYAMHWLTHRVTADIREQMFAKLVAMPTPFFDSTPASRIVSRITNDVGGLTVAATSVLTTLVRDSLTLVALFGWLLYLNWQLTLVTVLIAPPIMLAVRYFSRRLRSLSRSLLHSYGDFSQVLYEGTEGHRVVKVYGAQDYEKQRFHKSTEAFRHLNMRISVAGEILGPAVQLLTALALSIVVAMTLFQAQSGGTTVGAFVSFITAMLMLLPPAKRLAGLSTPLQRGLASAESVFSLLDEHPERDQGRTVLPRSDGRLHVDGLRFTYPGTERPALADISFAVRPGEMIAFVGASGSGKTTLLSLLLRFYEADEGRILIDGHDTRELTLASLRAQFSLVSQDVFLFNSSVAANIGYGQTERFSPEALRDAARAAYALDFIEALPAGFATEIGDKGIRLSGGQRQRLAIARAILKNAPILLLDEATSALDSESERYVQSAIESLMGRCTTLVIAHRLSTIRKADRIVVLAGGRIVESGSHDALLAADGEYRKLYDLQFRDQADGDAGA